MEELLNMIANYGLTLVLAGLFIWDWITNKKESKQTLETIGKTLETIKTSDETIASCLTEMKTSNENISKSLDILQITLDNQTQKIDKLLDRK